ncbi:MAG: D-glycero-beta-D-manno-heptose 1-phosphate adenylyltransferase [Deltaproteobacteria bacterium]|nr:D-glycero-beta-D-manno-heptose 1-phosphate adenylyltransferase [Deltaproteobacteria bacterium]MCL5277572.1 D-glycero-beta-D-manno-heptose 1-phosphate adenylyltransferase [Deltaproteobacteria bacterium]
MDASKLIADKRGLRRLIARLKYEKKRVVFTNGCFDIIHAGHTSYLESAKALGDILVVGLNSDASIKGIKGPRRPINDQRSRAAVLLSLRAVDYVYVFDEPTPLEVIEIVRPDILVKGGDWRRKEIVGAEFVRSYRGKVVTVPIVNRVSTTKLIGRILRLYA